MEHRTGVGLAKPGFSLKMCQAKAIPPARLAFNGYISGQTLGGAGWHSPLPLRRQRRYNGD